MRYELIILLFLIVGCSSGAHTNNSETKTESQKNNKVTENGILISVDNINVSKYELEIDDFEEEEITMNHLLCLATEECDEKLIRELIDKKVDVNFMCDGDHVITNLAYCKELGVRLTKMLLNKGANINGADQDNDSFLSYAISYDNLKLSEFLIDKGANQVQRDRNSNMGCLPIHGVESLAMLELLISKGFEINGLCNNGRNLLHFATRENLKEVAQHLIDNKLVDINHKDKNGETPLDYSKKFKNPDIAEIIKKKK